MKTAETEISDVPTSPERALWCAVIDQAIADAVYRPSMKGIFRSAATRSALSAAARRIAIERSPAGKKNDIGIKEMTARILSEEPGAVAERSRRIMFDDATRERVEARRWLTENSKDFQFVCYLAGMDSDAVLEHMQKLARIHWLIDEQTHKKIAKYRDGQ